MLDAICVMDESNQKMFSIFEFKALPENEIDKLRYVLLCPVCKQKAYFRKASRDGKQACFGSRYHALDCEEFNSSVRQSEEQQQCAEIEAMVLDNNAVQIDFSMAVKVKKTVKKDVSRMLTKTALITNKEAVSLRKQGLKKLLNSLLRGSALASADLWVYTSEKHKWRAKNLFVNVNEAIPTDNGAPRMYWGTISHADKSINWLNPAEERSVAIPIEKYREKLLSRFDISEARDLEGAGFIIFATCIHSKDKKRKFLQLWGNDVQHFYISKAEE